MKTYTHKKCGKEVQCKSLVHEYAPILSLEEGYIESGDVEDSNVESSVIWCENCCEEVEHSEVSEEGEADED